MAAVVQDITAEQGAALAVTLTGAGASLNGRTLRMHVRSKVGVTTTKLVASTTDGRLAVGANPYTTATLAIDADIMAAVSITLPTEYWVYDVESYTTAADVRREWSGRFTITRDVTRDTEATTETALSGAVLYSGPQSLTTAQQDQAWDNIGGDEAARDAIGAALVAGSNVTITVSDVANTITIAATGGAGGGSGDVVGPASATDDRIAEFDGITGKLLRESSYTIATLLAAAWARASHTGTQLAATISDFASAALSAVQSALDLKAPLASPAFTGTPTAPTATGGTNTTQIATTAFVAGALATAVTGLLEFIGDIDASASPNYPAGSKGDTYVITVAGKVGGASGKAVDVGDLVIAKADNAGGTEASVGASWLVLEHNLAGALLSANNLSDLASAATARSNLGLGGSATLAVGTTAGTVAAGDDARLTDDRAASGLRTASTVVAVSSATAPSSGQVLTATSSTAANWQTPSGGSSNTKWVGAGELIPRVTNGAGIDGEELATNDINLDYLAFDSATSEGAQVSFAWPGAYTTFTAQFHWTASSGSGTVTWAAAARCYADDDALDQAQGTAQSVTDTLLAANDAHKSSATSAVTPGGTVAAGNLCVAQFTRDIADTLAVDARLIGVMLEFA